VRLAVATGLLLVAALIQSLIGPSLPVLQGRPDFPLVIVLAWSMLRGSAEGAVVGFMVAAAGLVWLASRVGDEKGAGVGVDSFAGPKSMPASLVRISGGAIQASLPAPGQSGLIASTNSAGDA